MKIKKNLLVCITIFILAIFITSCAPSVPSSTIYQIKNGDLLLDKEGTIPLSECNQRSLTDKIIVLESEYCGACQVAVPKIKAVAKELGATVTYLDLAVKSDNDKMNEMYILPYYTPTMVVGCKVYIGGKTESEYKSIISEFLNK